MRHVDNVPFPSQIPFWTALRVANSNEQLGVQQNSNVVIDWESIIRIMRGEGKKYNPTQSRNMSNHQWNSICPSLIFYLPQNNFGHDIPHVCVNNLQSCRILHLRLFIIFFKSQYQYIESSNFAARIGISSNMYYQSFCGVWCLYYAGIKTFLTISRKIEIRMF